MSEPSTACEKCGHVIVIGDFPYCKGSPDDHVGNTPFIATLDYIDPHISTKGPVHITSHAQRRRLMRANGLEEHGISNGLPGRMV